MVSFRNTLALVTLMSALVWTVPANAQLSAPEVRQLLVCQDTIKTEGRTFMREKLRFIENCIDALLDPQLQLDNGIITQEEYDAKIARAEEQCQDGFEQISQNSTRFVNRVVNKCGPVEAQLFGPDDPLAYQELIGFLGSFGIDISQITTVEELAGVICLGKEVLVDAAAIIEAPRVLDIFFLFLAQGAQLDPRCLAVLN
jgi:hypothetical protein